MKELYLRYLLARKRNGLSAWQAFVQAKSSIDRHESRYRFKRFLRGDPL